MASVEQQNEWESRRLWMNVAKGIREGDFEVAAREKSKIEVRFFSFLFSVLCLGVLIWLMVRFL